MFFIQAETAKEQSQAFTRREFLRIGHFAIGSLQLAPQFATATATTSVVPTHKEIVAAALFGRNRLASDFHNGLLPDVEDAEDNPAALAALDLYSTRSVIYHTVLPQFEALTQSLSRTSKGILSNHAAMHASWEFAKRASEGDNLNLLRTQPATEVERDCIRLCERGIQVCNTSDYVPIALTEAAKIASQGKYRGFGIDAGELATETLESFGRKRALDNYAPHLTPDNTEEAKKIFREFARTIAQRTFSDRCKELNRNNLVSEFVQEAPMPQLAPEVDDERIRAALNSITEGMKKELKNELPVLDYLRQGYKPAQIAKMLDISVATVHKRKSRAIFKIKQAALQRVKEADLIPANWVIVRDVRANFQIRKEAALAQAKEQGNTNLGEVKVEMLDLAIETVAKEHNLSVEEVKKTINFACRQVYPRLNQDDMTEF